MGDAQMLPLDDNIFDVAVMALVDYLSLSEPAKAVMGKWLA